ncbi:hypothetical protein LNQ81_06290 [Myroides sp. M-43]|uniref:hypothetical protein n=1 Tax=Myroides oncorhynchi TaxID=2893756 RepID=UPI001E59FF7C|nr:hypothetical protein [Myroides oncorhynchi]MCC9042300.1 hypothetical protein [Myroides oncorhynchi]
MKKGVPFFLQSKEDAHQYYSQAIAGFKWLISLPDNSSLEEELKEDLGIGFSDIHLKEKEIRVFWYATDYVEYTIEAELSLLNIVGDEIGIYVYVMDKEGIGIDDRISFC